MALWYIAVSLILVAILVALASVASLIFVFCFRHHAGPMACDYCKYFIQLICKVMKGITFQLLVQGVLALCEFPYCKFSYCGFSKLSRSLAKDLANAILWTICFVNASIC